MVESKKICVVGLGYVGLTLSVVLAEKGFQVYGITKSEELAEQLRNGKPHFHEKGLEVLLKKFVNKNLFISATIPADIAMDVFVISVGTPLDKSTKKPIISHIESAVTDVAKNLRPGGLVVLRSTVPVGLTRNYVLPMIQKHQKERFYLAFASERTIEGKALSELKYLPQVIGGLDEESLNKASEIFIQVTKTIIRVSSLESAEMIKILDNSYRDLTFAFANEVAMVSRQLGLNAIELIEAANFGYPRTNVPVPGFVGGACLEKDPHILVDFATTAGYTPQLVAMARKVNESLPVFTADLVRKHCAANGKDIATAKIFVSGLAFKGRPETDDLRGSPTVDFLKCLQEAGAKNIHGHDFVVKREAIVGLGITPCTLEEGFQGADCVLFMNNHVSYEYFDIEKLLPNLNQQAFFFDGWHLFDSKVIKSYSHITYEGLGER
ncbi:MAG: UDP-glucose/GDP-mannose dehydrogenase [Parcubacteria group bacterium Gr01-1014_13]|nr:MAG: UDP-glucose/GDP-mannose dehydrogenase [Parcubacteria group bacterium Gr01-1014_13]